MSRGVVRILGVAVALTGLAVAVPAAGQVGMGTDLDRTARALAGAWQAGNADALALAMSGGGIGLHLPEASHPMLSVRLARAALADLYRRAGRGSVEVRQMRRLGGSPPRGFVEMGWRPVPDGMMEPLEYTVFAGLEEVEGTWRIVELRVLARQPGPGTESRPAPRRPWR